MTDHLAEISDDPDDRDSDYGRGWDAGYRLGHRRGYEAGFRDAGQPTSKQPVAGEFTEMRIIQEADDE